MDCIIYSSYVNPRTLPLNSQCLSRRAPLEYIEATGAQYIDTGVNAETGLQAQIDFAWAEQERPLSALKGHSGVPVCGGGSLKADAIPAQTTTT